MSSTLTRAAQPWALPDGRLVLPAGAPREAWLAERRKGIGSSDIALLMGVAQGGSEYELWLDKTRGHSVEQTGAMQRGKWLEPHLADYFAARTGLVVRRCGLARHRLVDEQLATPDRLSEDGRCVEIKSMGNHAKVRAEWRGGGVARHAYVQLQWQLMVTGRCGGWLVAYEIDHEPVIRGPIERDQALMVRMSARAMAWWGNYVLTRTPPPPDLATITDEEIALRWPDAVEGSTRQAEWPHYVRALLDERAEMHAQQKAAEDRKGEIDKALKVMIGDSEILLIGEHPVVTLKKRAHTPSIDPALPIDHPEIDAKYIKRGSSRCIHICKGWTKA